MWEVDGDVKIACDSCGETTTCKIGWEFQDWLNEARAKGWIMIVGNPVPFVGLAICNKCAELYLKRLGNVVIELDKLSCNANPIGSLGVTCKTITELTRIVLGNKQAVDNTGNKDSENLTYQTNDGDEYGTTDKELEFEEE